jgi:hypothetical protein
VHIKYNLALSALLAFVVPALGMAAAPAQNPGQAPTGISNPGSLQQLPATRKALEEAKAGTYGKLRAEERLRLEAADREIGLLIADHNNLNELDAQERMRLFNAQETVMATVSRLRREEIVCTHRARAGTRFKTKHCMTREMADAIKRATREDLRASQNPMCTPNANQDCMTGLQELNIDKAGAGGL